MVAPLFSFKRDLEFRGQVINMPLNYKCHYCPGHISNKLAKSHLDRAIILEIIVGVNSYVKNSWELLCLLKFGQPARIDCDKQIF